MFYYTSVWTWIFEILYPWFDPLYSLVTTHIPLQYFMKNFEWNLSTCKWKNLSKKDWRICLLDTINFANSTLTKKSNANSCLLRYWLLLQNCKKSCHFRAIWRKTFLPSSRVRIISPFFVNKWYDIISLQWNGIISLHGYHF